MCEALASVWNSACGASWAPRNWPGVQPCSVMILWPKEVVFLDHFVLFGSLESLNFLHGRLVSHWFLAETVSDDAHTSLARRDP